MLSLPHSFALATLCAPSLRAPVNAATVAVAAVAAPTHRGRLPRPLLVPMRVPVVVAAAAAAVCLARRHGLPLPVGAARAPTLREALTAAPIPAWREAAIPADGAAMWHIRARLRDATPYHAGAYAAADPDLVAPCIHTDFTNVSANQPLRLRARDGELISDAIATMSPCVMRIGRLPRAHAVAKEQQHRWRERRRGPRINSWASTRGAL